MDYSVPPSNFTPPRPRRRLRLVLAGGLAVVLIAAGVCAWVFLVRPRQLVEVHDSTGRISVRVPRAWTKEVEGRKPSDRGAYLLIGKFEEPRVMVSVFDAAGTITPGRECDSDPVSQVVTKPDADLHFWVSNNCPEGRTTLYLQRSVEGQYTAIIKVQADNEKSARHLATSVKVS
jgi:hypothetical protein